MLLLYEQECECMSLPPSKHTNYAYTNRPVGAQSLLHRQWLTVAWCSAHTSSTGICNEYK